MSQRNESINERRRERLRRRKVDQVIEEADRTVADHSEAAEDLIQKHGLEGKVKPEEIMSSHSSSQNTGLSWKYRYGLRLFKLWAWCRSKFRKGD